MIGDDALPYILNKKSHIVRNKWLNQRGEKVEVVNVSKIIDSLNDKIGGDYGKEAYVCNLQKKEEPVKNDKCLF